MNQQKQFNVTGKRAIIWEITTAGGLYCLLLQIAVEGGSGRGMRVGKERQTSNCAPPPPLPLKKHSIQIQSWMTVFPILMQAIST